MKKKGFTLIELLAVIVILAIIALIATPIIMGVIEDAKKNSAKDSAYGYIDGVNNYYARQMLNNSTFKLEGTYSVDKLGKLNNIDLGIKGTKPIGGSLIYSNNKITSGCLTIDGYKVTITNDKAEKVEKGVCEESGPTIIEAPTNATYKKIMYADPTDLTKKCTEENIVSTTETKTGCMKWYAYKDNGDGTYNWILDHNTTAEVAWNSSENNLEGMKEIKVELDKLTSESNWKITPRVITADEVADIVGASSSDTIKWNSSKKYGTTTETSAWIYLDGGKNGNKISYSFTDGWQKQYAKGTIKSNYAWLYDNTYPCSNYGCNVQGENENTSAYWTSSAVSDDPVLAWTVDCNGCLIDDNVRSTYGGVGLRPVITF